MDRRIYIGGVATIAVILNLLLLYSGASNGIPFELSFAVACLAMSFLLAQRPKIQPLPQSVQPKLEANRATSANIYNRPTVPGPINALTIDLEDYFHTEVASRSVCYQEWDRMPSRIERSVHRLLDVLDESKTAATFFVLGWVARKHPHLVREVAGRGHEIACHSYRHQMVNRLTPTAFLADTRTAKEVIEDATGVEVYGYRAPSFSITPGTEWAFSILEDLGFSYDSSVHPVWHATYANVHAPRFPYYQKGTMLLEIPIATWRVGGVNLPVGGGAYLRLLPYRYIEHGLASVNRKEWQPVTVYLHPWEIDYLQPSIHNSWMSHVRQMWGTRAMEDKLRRLLVNGTFTTISEVYADNLLSKASYFGALAQSIPSYVRVS